MKKRAKRSSTARKERVLTEAELKKIAAGSFFDDVFSVAQEITRIPERYNRFADEVARGMSQGS